VSAWAVAAARTVQALREQPELGVPDDVVVDFERYVDEWRELAASSPATFRWDGDVEVAEVRRLASYWALLANIARTEVHPTGVEPATEEARPFYDALVAAMAEVLAVDDADRFSDKFEEVAPSFDAEIPAPGAGGAGEQRTRVLLVDDTEDIRLLFRIALQSHAGFEVCGEATNGQEALDAVARGCPDAILLDVMMPVMDGLSALPLLVERCPDTRIVVVTSAPTPEVRREALEKGALAVVDKQVSLDELRLVLATV
jgi:CheY-like chemotaxis protein